MSCNVVGDHSVHDDIGGHMDTSVIAPVTTRPRRRHTAEFKAQVVAACLQPGVSIAGVALANQLNANLLRSWVSGARDQQRGGVSIRIGGNGSAAPTNCSPPTLVPVAVQNGNAPASGDIQIEIRRQQTVFQIAWPISQATACAQWLRELLR